MLVDLGLATWGAQPRSGLGTIQRSPPLGLSKLSSELRNLCEQGQLDRAWKVVLRMGSEGTVPSVIDYRKLLKACAKKKDLVQAKQVHAHLAQHGLESATILGEDAVSALVRCGGLEDALQVFHRLHHRSTFCWTAIISGYSNAGEGQEALRMYLLMQVEGVKPNEYTFISLLKACGSIADLEAGRRIHAEALKYGYLSDMYVCSSLVVMYGKCKSIVDAQNVFDGLAQPDVVSWNAMLTAYVEQGQAEKALQLYEQMSKRGVSPSSRTFVSLVQACGALADKEDAVAMNGRCVKVKSLKRGEAVHADAHRKGYDSDLFVGNTLISMYGKCGSIENARNVFIGISRRNVVTWNVMLAAYVEQGQAERALDLYEQMRKDGLSLTDRTFVSVLQACSILAGREEGVMVEGVYTKLDSLKRGRAVHACARRSGYGSDSFVGNTLVTMYGKCGAIVDAQNVFNMLSHRDVVSWNALLTAYVDQGQAEKVLQLYEQMRKEDVLPDNRTFVSTLQACSMLADNEKDVTVNGRSVKVMSLKKGEALHADARRQGYDLDFFVGSSLVSMYGKCGSIKDAECVFDALPRRDVVLWNTMLAAYVERGQAEKALQLFTCMREKGLRPDNRTFVSTLQACGMVADKEDGMVDEQFTKVKALKMGVEIHADAQTQGYDSDVFVANTLISMYGKCGSLVNARRVFDGLAQRDVVSWNVVVAAHIEHGDAQKTLQLYEEMLEGGVSPDNWTFASMLQACGMLADKEEGVMVDGQCTKAHSLKVGKRIHAAARRKGYDADVFVGSTLVIMYGKCGSIANAEIVFDGLPCRDIVTSNSMLTAYIQQDKDHKALQLYGRLLEEGPSPDSRTFVSALQACGILADKEEEVMVGRQATKVKSLRMVEGIHIDARKKGYDTDFFVCNTLISVYGKCGSLVDAQRAFDLVSPHDVVTWTALLTAYVDQGQVETVLQLYQQMQEEGVSPNDVTNVCMLQACGKAGNLGTLRQIHDSLLVSTGTDLSPLLANSLITAYGRCSRMVDAQAVFEELTQPDTVSWTALLAAYARQGDHVATLQCYDKMQLAGVNPNKVTFLSLLCACSHAGLVEKGAEYFESMNKDHGINPEVEHYGTMVDLLGRAGYFTQVEELLSRMPVAPDLAMWSCLLGACQKHGKLVLGKWAFERAVLLQPQHPAAYVLMANIYSDAGLWDDAQLIRDLKRRAGAWKKPGQSWIEHDDRVSTFVVGNQVHQKQLRCFLAELNVRLEGQIPGLVIV